MRYPKNRRFSAPVFRASLQLIFRTRIRGMRAKLLAFIAPVLFVAVAAQADEGMWTFDNFPSAAVRQKYNVDISQAWLDRVRNAAVRLSSGCSASVVSQDGLVLTNHHCVRDCVQALSTAQVNYI